MQNSKHLTCDEGVETMRRLQGLARSRKLNTQVVCQKFLLERVLGRLFASRHAETFALKGGMLMMYAEGVEPLFARMTDDLDLQVPGFEGTIDDFARVVREILADPSFDDDGVRFDLSQVKVQARNEELVPGGRMTVPAQIGGVGVRFKVDVTFDCRPVFDVALEDEVPSVLPDRFGPVRVRRIPLSWTLADKIQAQVRHGGSTTRLRDFYDMHLIVARGLADPAETAAAVRMTFDLFRCPLPAHVADIAAFSEEYGRRNAREWERSKKERGYAVDVPDLVTILAGMREAVAPVLAAAAAMEPRPAEDWLPRRAGP